MRVVRKLTVCGLRYRVVTATAEEVPALGENEGYTSVETCTIYLRQSLERSRMRDTLLHEVFHAFIEASGIGALLEENYGGTNFDRFEETLIRLLVPSVLRFVEDNGDAAVVPPPTVRSRVVEGRARAKKGRKR